MTTDANPAPNESGKTPVSPDHQLMAHLPFRQMPGVFAVSVYMMILAGIDVVYVVQHRIGPLYLVLSAFFFASALGLLLLLRWAWALALAAVALMSALYMRAYFTDQSWPALEEALLNLVIFLYLVRTDLRDKLH
jgi:hypothetical protein